MPEVAALAAGDDGRLLAGGVGKAAVLWDSHTGRTIRSFEGHGEPVRRIAFQPGAKALVTVAGERQGEGYRDVIRFWDVDTGESIRVVESDLTGIDRLEFSSDGDVGWLGARVAM